MQKMTVAFPALFKGILITVLLAPSLAAQQSLPLTCYPELPIRVTGPVGDSTEHLLILANEGTSRVPVFDIAVTGRDADRFVLLSSPTGSFTPGEYRVLRYSFIPVQEGQIDAQLRIIHAGSEVDTTFFDVEGTGIPATAAMLRVAPDHVTAEEQFTDELWTATLELRNPSSESIRIDDISFIGAHADDFSLEIGIPAVLASGETGSAVITAAGGSAGERWAMARIAWNDTQYTDVMLEIEWIRRSPELEFSRNPFFVGNVMVGESDTSDMRFWNTGRTTLILSDFVLEGSDAALFSHTLPDALHIGPGKSRNISFSFTPTETGERSVELRMRSNDADAPQPVLVLTGNGVAYQRPRMEVQPSGINLPFTYYGHESSTEFVVYNAGTAPLHIAGIENQTLPPFEGFPRETYYPHELTIHPGSPRRVEIGDSLTVTVLYHPLAENSRQVKFSWIVISSDDPEQPVVKLHVNASAGNAPIVGLSQYHMEFPAVPIHERLDVSLGVYSRYDGRFRSATITGPDAAHFEFIEPTSFDTRPDHITVRYHQGESGKRVAHLALETNDLLSPVIEVLLVGYDDATMSLRENAIPDELALEAWPNPFSASTSLTYVLPRPGPVHIHLLDVVGRQLRTVHREHAHGGKHILHFEREGLPAGIYFLHLRSGTLTATTRLLLLAR